MTTIEKPETEKMNGSSRIVAVTDSPWWLVRPSLAVSLIGSFGLAASVFQYVEMPGSGVALTQHSLTALMQILSATPTLIGLAVFAFAGMFRRSSRRALRILCILLALASVTGAWINSLRDSHGRGPIEIWVEKALSDAPVVLAWV